LLVILSTLPHVDRMYVADVPSWSYSIQGRLNT
jgi:hypothetical protein